MFFYLIITYLVMNNYSFRKSSILEIFANCVVFWGVVSVTIVARYWEELRASLVLTGVSDKRFRHHFDDNLWIKNCWTLTIEAAPHVFNYYEQHAQTSNSKLLNLSSWWCWEKSWKKKCHLDDYVPSWYLQYCYIAQWMRYIFETMDLTFVVCCLQFSNNLCSFQIAYLETLEFIQSWLKWD